MTDQNRLLNRAVKLDTDGKTLVVNIIVVHTWCIGTAQHMGKLINTPFSCCFLIIRGQGYDLMEV